MLRGRAVLLLSLVVPVAAPMACRPSGPTPGSGPDAPPTASVEPIASSSASVREAQSAVPPAAQSAPPVASASPSTTPAPASSASRPVPPIAQLATIALEQMQGGPSIARCKRVSYAVTIDLAKNEWTYGLCVPTAAGKPTESTPLTTTRGKLKPEQRARIEAAYGRLTIETARGCGNDGGPLTLRLVRTAGGSESYVDENWGCKKPPPEIAKGVKDFANTMMLIVNAP